MWQVGAEIVHFYPSYRIWHHLITGTHRQLKGGGRVTSPQKQVTDVSLLLKDSDTESENLSSLIRLSVSDGQKTDSLNVVSFIGI